MNIVVYGRCDRRHVKAPQYTLKTIGGVGNGKHRLRRKSQRGMR